MLPRLARCVLSRLRRSGESFLLGSYLSRIGRIENPSCSAYGHLSSHSALSSYGLFAPLTFWRLSVYLRPLVQTLGSVPASGAPWFSAMPPSLGRGRVNNKKSRDRPRCDSHENKSRSCGPCGNSQDKNLVNCFAYNKTCNKCKVGHFES